MMKMTEIFDNDLEKGKRGSKLALNICKKKIPNFQVEPIDHGGEGDKLFSTDWRVMIDGKQQNWAVKIRDIEYLEKYQDITVEMMNGTWSKDKDLKKEDYGDYWEFDKEGGVKYYLYGWFTKDREEIKEFRLLNAEKLVDIPMNKWKQQGDLINLPYFDRAVKCIRNEEHGKSYFKAISLDKAKKAQHAQYNKGIGLTIEKPLVSPDQTNKKGKQTYLKIEDK